jgi:hypothetical protein
MNRFVRLSVAVMTALVVSAAPVPATAAADPPQGPAGDAFYTPPDPLPNSANGDVIWWRELPAQLTGNVVTGDIQLFTNRGALSVSGNRINGNLQCKENASTPTGGGNVVGGNKEDQCVGL